MKRYYSLDRFISKQSLSTLTKHSFYIWFHQKRKQNDKNCAYDVVSRLEVTNFPFSRNLAYGVCQKFVAQTFESKSNVKDISLLGNATAGFLAAFFSSFTLCPTELIKCKLQALHEMKQTARISPYQLTKQILKNEGVKGMFRGLTPTFAREMPGYFFFFGGYELTREVLAK